MARFYTLRHKSQHSPKVLVALKKWDSPKLVPPTFRLQSSSKGSQGGMLTNSGFLGCHSFTNTSLQQGNCQPSATETGCHRVLMGRNYSDRLDATRIDQQGLLTHAIGSRFSVGMAVQTTLSFLAHLYGVSCKLQWLAGSSHETGTSIVSAVVKHRTYSKLAIQAGVISHAFYL